MALACSVSTAMTLSACFYYLLKNTNALKNLVAEIDSSLLAVEPGATVPFQSAQKMPYLDARIKETFRLHSAARFSSERVLPLTGATIAGHDIPSDSVVGVKYVGAAPAT